MKTPERKLYQAAKPRGIPIVGGAIGQDDIHTTGEQFAGTKSGRGLSSQKPKNIILRVSLTYELIYDDVQFMNRDEWEKYGIPDIFGEEQFVFFEKRNKHKIIIIHKLSINQIEARQS